MKSRRRIAFPKAQDHAKCIDDYSRDLQSVEWGVSCHFAHQQLARAHVSSGSKADISECPRNVRYSPESGHPSARSRCQLWAISDQRTAAAFYSISSNNTRIHGSHLAEPFTASEADGPLKVEKSSEKW
jgi:hypothetical protein